MSDAGKKATTTGAIIELLVAHDECDRDAILEAVRALIKTAPPKAAASRIDFRPHPQGTASR